MADGPIAVELNQSPGRARFHSGQLVGEAAAEAAQQLRVINRQPVVNGDEIERALISSLKRQILESV